MEVDDAGRGATSASSSTARAPMDVDSALGYKKRQKRKCEKLHTVLMACMAPAVRMTRTIEKCTVVS